MSCQASNLLQTAKLRRPPPSHRRHSARKSLHLHICSRGRDLSHAARSLSARIMPVCVCVCMCPQSISFLTNEISLQCHVEVQVIVLVRSVSSLQTYYGWYFGSFEGPVSGAPPPFGFGSGLLFDCCNTRTDTK